MLVFASPILDFKEVSESLSKQYKVVIVERAGYGYSDDSNYSRDVMEVLSETRQALSQANITGPFIILSHSMASLESLAWQEKYPDEVKALIGLDWALPSSYENLRIIRPCLRWPIGAVRLGYYVISLSPFI